MVPHYYNLTTESGLKQIASFICLPGPVETFIDWLFGPSKAEKAWQIVKDLCKDAKKNGIKSITVEIESEHSNYITMKLGGLYPFKVVGKNKTTQTIKINF